jgi:hypothetical protein
MAELMPQHVSPSRPVDDAYLKSRERSQPSVFSRIELFLKPALGLEPHHHSGGDKHEQSQ